MPRAYGYVPADSDLYNIEAEKVAARQKMFDSIDLKSSGVIIDEGSVDDYKKFITK